MLSVYNLMSRAVHCGTDIKRDFFLGIKETEIKFVPPTKLQLCVSSFKSGKVKIKRVSLSFFFVLF